MGRKIPGKKHRGVKDPYEQQLVKNESVKHKINAPPKDIEEQPLPEKLQKIIEWRQFEGEGKNKKKRRKKTTLIDSRQLDEPEILDRGMRRPDKPTPAFIQRPGESDRTFLARIDEMCKDVIKDSKIHSKSDYETEDTDVKVKKRKGDIDEIMNAGGTKNKKASKEQLLSKKDKIKQMLAAKKQAKIEKVKERLSEQQRFRDHVEFGEVVHAPPVLSLPSRNKLKIDDGKPGQRELILNRLLTSSDGVSNRTNKKKMKGLSEGERDQIEKNRLKAVEDYRRFKRNKRTKIDP